MLLLQALSAVTIRADLNGPRQWPNLWRRGQNCQEKRFSGISAQAALERFPSRLGPDPACSLRSYDAYRTPGLPIPLPRNARENPLRLTSEEGRRGWADHDCGRRLARYRFRLVCLVRARRRRRRTAEDYPARTVTIVNPFAPGGGTDLLARMLAPSSSSGSARASSIENKTGAGSIIAAVAVQKSAPDGYTLLMAPAPTMAVNVSLYKSLPYEPLTDFVPLALLAQTPFVLIVNPELPVQVGAPN